jgi:hypothetical protein
LDHLHPTRSKRIYFRWPFEKHIVIFPATQASESPAAMVCSNLSAGGLRGICIRSVPIGQLVVAALPELHGGVVAVRARVVRCTPDKSGAFAWSLRFEDPIDPTRHVQSDALANEFVNEYVAPHMIRGRIALISDSAHDRALFTLTLRDAPCVLTTHAALEPVLFDARHLDVVVLASDHSQHDISDAIVSLIAAESPAAFVLLASDRSARTRKLAAMLPFKAALIRPCTQQMILAALAQSLGILAVDESSQQRDAAA